MGNRSRYFAAGATTAAALLAARGRARLRAAADEIRVSILPTHGHDLPGDRTVVSEGHAPGHRHLPAPDEAHPRRRAWTRPWRPMSREFDYTRARG